MSNHLFGNDDKILSFGKAELIEHLIQHFPDRNVDQLVCRPDEAAKYCRTFREMYGVDMQAFDSDILRALMNCRKAKEMPTGLGEVSRKSTKNRLREENIELTQEVFEEGVVECLADMYKSQTLDEVLCHPPEAIQLCDYARQKLSCPAASDFLILWTIMKVRKANNSH